MTAHCYTIRLPHVHNLGRNRVADSPEHDTQPVGYRVYDRARGLYLFRITGAGGPQWTPNENMARVYHRPYTAAVVGQRYANVPVYSHAAGKTRSMSPRSYGRNITQAPVNRPLAEWLNIGMVINREEYTA